VIDAAQGVASSVSNGAKMFPYSGATYALEGTVCVKEDITGKSRLTQAHGVYAYDRNDT
jgi:hypothetical protein